MLQNRVHHIADVDSHTSCHIYCSKHSKDLYELVTSILKNLEKREKGFFISKKSFIPQKNILRSAKEALENLNFQACLQIFNKKNIDTLRFLPRPWYEKVKDCLKKFFACFLKNSENSPHEIYTEKIDELNSNIRSSPLKSNNTKTYGKN